MKINKTLIIVAFMLMLSTFISYGVGCNSDSCVNWVEQDNLIRWWRLNDTTTANGGTIIDYSLTDDITINYFGTGSISKAIDSYGITDGAYLFTRNDNINEAYLEADVPTSDLGFFSYFTYNFWFNPTTSYNTEQFLMACSVSNSLKWGFRFDGSGQADILYNGAIPIDNYVHSQDTNWHFWSVRGNSTHITLFIDGVQVTTNTYSNSDLADCKFTTSQEQSGNFYHNPSGTMTDITIYDTDLSAGQILGLYDGTGYTTPILPTSNLDIIISDNFTENENINVALNYTYTSNSSIITEANCTVTIDDTLLTSVGYNITTGLYHLLIPHSEDQAGTYNVYGNCTHTLSNLDNSISTTIDIINIPPIINNITLTYTNGTILLYNDIIIEFYDNGYWNFTLDITDDDIDTTIFTIYNNSLDIIYSTINPVDDFISIPSTLFNEFFDLPYSISVYVNDTDGDYAQLDINITINDTRPPELEITEPSGLLSNSTTFENGNSIDFNILFEDEALFRTGLMLYLQNGTILYNSESEHNPTVLSYHLIDSTGSINASPYTKIYGKINVSDGHTLINIEDRLKTNVKKGLTNEIITQDFKMVFMDDLQSIDLVYTIDRVKQKIKYQNKLSIANIRVYPLNDANIEIIESTIYFNYLIIDDYWSDYMSKDTDNVIIYKVNGGEYYDVYVYFDKPVQNIDFESIGIINTVEKDFFISVIEPTVSEEADTSLLNFDISKQSNVFILLSLILCMLGCYFIGFYFKNFMFISFGFFTGLLLGFLFFQIHWIVTAIFWLLNASIFISLGKGKF